MSCRPAANTHAHHRPAGALVFFISNGNRILIFQRESQSRSQSQVNQAKSKVGTSRELPWVARSHRSFKLIPSSFRSPGEQEIIQSDTKQLNTSLFKIIHAVRNTHRQSTRRPRPARGGLVVVKKPLRSAPLCVECGSHSTADCPLKWVRGKSSNQSSVSGRGTRTRTRMGATCGAPPRGLSRRPCTPGRRG